MHDLVVRGGTVVDGTGAPAFGGDVAVTGGRVTEVGRVDGRGRREVDAAGLCVSPGFVDGHTHLDAQIFWDPLATSASLHGVTTAVMGNCGFTLAPSPPAAPELAIRSIERAEDIARADLLSGVPWTWEHYADYLDAVARVSKAINVAGYVGHSAVRTYVMGERGFTDPASPDEVAAMRREVRAAMLAGAVGFSTSRISQHRTVDDQLVASAVGTWDEVRSLAGPLGELGAGVVQVAADAADPGHQAELRAIAAGSGRPVHVVCASVPGRPDGWRQALGLLDGVAADGGTVVGQVHAREFANTMGFRVGLPFDRLPVWRDVRARSLDAQRAALEDPDQRAALVAAATEGHYETTAVAAEVQARLPDYDRLRVLQRPTGPNPSVAELAAARRTTPVDVMIDLSLDSGFDQYFTQPFANDDPVAVEALLRHPRTVLAQSDSGAHVTQIIDSCIPTYLLASWVRERRVLRLEEAVRMLTAQPADHWGLADRGRVAPGCIADLVLFDPDRVGPALPTAVADLPAGGTRLVQDSVGIHAVVVAGEILRLGGEFTDARPGRLLRGPAAAGR